MAILNLNSLRGVAIALIEIGCPDLPSHSIRVGVSDLRNDWKLARLIDVDRFQEGDIGYVQMANAFKHSQMILETQFPRGFSHETDLRPHPATLSLGLRDFKLYLTGFQKGLLLVRACIEIEEKGFHRSTQGFCTIETAEVFGRRVSAELRQRAINSGVTD